jgi:hypothetical protein
MKETVEIRRLTLIGPLLLAITFAVPMAFGQGVPMKLEGDVIRENGSPISGITIVATERAPWSPIALIADRVVGRAISDGKGRFTMQVPHETKIKRLILVASGEWERMETKDRKDIGLMGTSVPLRKVKQRKLNRIVVPNSFRPAK